MEEFNINSFKKENNFILQSALLDSNVDYKTNNYILELNKETLDLLKEFFIYLYVNGFNEQKIKIYLIELLNKLDLNNIIKNIDVIDKRKVGGLIKPESKTLCYSKDYLMLFDKYRNHPIKKAEFILLFYKTILHEFTHISQIKNRNDLPNTIYSRLLSIDNLILRTTSKEFYYKYHDLFLIENEANYKGILLTNEFLEYMQLNEKEITLFINDLIMDCLKNPIDKNSKDPLLDRFSYLYKLYFEYELNPNFYKSLTNEQKILLGLTNDSSLKYDIILESQNYYNNPNNLESVKKLIKRNH